MIKLWVDDVREAPDGWMGIMNPIVALQILKLGNVVELSLDHDLGEDRQTGYDIICWLESQLFMGYPCFVPRDIRCHSANPVGRAKIEAAIASIENYRRINND